MSKEAMKLKTAAEKVVELCGERPLSLGRWFIDMSEACESLREALVEQPAQQEQNTPLDCGMYLGTGKDRAIKHHVSYGIEPVDTLIAAWQALEETSGHVLDEGGVEGRMHMSVIRSAWRQMDSLVRDMWDERGRK